MKKIDVEELRRIQLDILKHIDEFCQEHGLTYFISGGTLIGAVRHKGFIPWDDDIDIMMKRDDYDKLMKLYPVKDKSYYKLYSFEIDKKFPYPYAKMDDSRTLFDEEITDKYKMGVNIDIFPIDTISDNVNIQKEVVERNKRWIQLITLKRIPIKRGRSFSKNVVLALAHLVTTFIPYSFIVSKIINNARMAKCEKSSHQGCLVWGYGLREIINISALADSIRLPFEDCTFSAPKGYDTYLKALFGNYMELPPVEKRQTHHSFKAYWK